MRAASASRGFVLLPWDTEFFGVRVGRILDERLTATAAREADRWVEAEGIECLTFLADPSDRETVAVAEAAGFRLTDVRVTLDRALPPLEPAPPGGAPEIRPATADDVRALKAIARVGHTETRFYFDGHFPAERCALLYETWIERSVGGWAELVLTADVAGRPAGYVTGHLDGPGEGRIGILGVAEEARGRGLAAALIRSSLDWFAGRGVRHVSVSTQGRNVAAQRTYQKAGFRTAATRLWYHRWAVDSAVRGEP